MPENGDRRFRATRGTGAKRTGNAQQRSTSSSHTSSRSAGGSSSTPSSASHASSRSTSYASARSKGRVPTRTSTRAASHTSSKSSQPSKSTSSRSAKSMPSRTSRTSETASTRTARSSENPPARTSRSSARKSSKQRVQGKTSDSMQFESRRIGDIRRSERRERAKESSRRYLVRIFIAIGVIVALIAGWAALYNSPAFAVTNVQIEGVEHLTSEEMSQLANVPSDTTLLRVDTETIRKRLMQTAWVEDASVTRVFPHTIKITVTEREIEAIVEIPNRSGSSTKKWAIAKDHIWLMPIPDPDSEAAKTTSAKIYEDAEAALHITDVPYGTEAEIGQPCQDSNVNNALDIIAGMTTDLANHVETVSAAGPAETTLLLDNGVEIAFGKAENIRDKERVILQILEENPDSVAYINVRLVETPTWRSI